MSINKKHKIAMGILILLAVFSIGYFQFFHEEKSVSGKVSGNNFNSITLTSLTYSNFPSEMSSNSMVKAIPEDSTILLKFYNFNSGEREWERSFTLTRGKVIQGGTKGDIILSIHSKYLSGLTNLNLCSVIKKANSNGDLGFETDLSKASLLWKFKSLLGYRDCFGL